MQPAALQLLAGRPFNSSHHLVRYLSRPIAQPTHYEVAYWRISGVADLTHALLDVAGAPYGSTFLDAASWAGLKDSTTFGKVPCLTIHFADGTTKELSESLAIETYLAETLDLFPGTVPDAFTRAECSSVVFALKDLDEHVRKTGDLPTVEARKEEHSLKNAAELIPSFLRF